MANVVDQVTAKKAVAVALKADVPTLLWGDVGIGKSSFVRTLAQHLGYHCEVVIGSILDPTDVKGLPYLADGSVRFARPSFLTVTLEKPTILFLDELTTAPPSVQAALLRLVLERAVDDFVLPPTTRILAAANPPEVAVSGYELSLPLANRFVHLLFPKPSPKDIGSYFRYSSIDADREIAERLKEVWEKDMSPYLRKWGSLIATFLEHKEPALCATPYREGAEFPNNYAFPRPRTWEYLQKLMAACDIFSNISPTEIKATDLHAVLAEGTIGTGATSAFMNWISQLDIPNLWDVIDGKVAFPSRQDIQLVLAQNWAIELETALTQNNTARLKKLFNFIPVVHEVVKQTDLVLLMLSYTNEVLSRTKKINLAVIYHSPEKYPYVNEKVLSVLKFAINVWDKARKAGLVK